ncbi:MAG: hypothetical protein IJ046_01130 [Clostridia bacterium]|nr:hypothetical protein [Clostridia bacterium]
MAESNVHKNHRQRCRQKYEKFGADIFNTHELVEMLLYHSIKQGDTNPLAHNVLEKSPRGGIGASASDLIENEGIGENSANLLRVSADTTLRLLCDMLSEGSMSADFTKKAFLWLWFRSKGPRCVGALLLNRQNKLVDYFLLAAGRTVRPVDYAATLIDKMNECGAKKAVICHNHADQTVEPSNDDIYLTAYLRRRLSEADLILDSHYIITDTDCVECRAD